VAIFLLYRGRLGQSLKEVGQKYLIFAKLLEASLYLREKIKKCEIHEQKR
jgi:hypothetical protein